MKQGNKIQGRWDRIKRLFDIGLVLLIATGIVTFSKDRLVNAFTAEGLSQFPVAQLSVLLFLGEKVVSAGSRRNRK